VKTAVAFAGGVVATLLVAGAVLHFTDLEITDEGAGDLVLTVPNVLGQSGVDAEAQLDVGGFRVNLLQHVQFGTFSKELGGGAHWHPATPSEAAVRRQRPNPGAEVEPDTVVTLGVR
jgi:hypothetical protein